MSNKQILIFALMISLSATLVKSGFLQRNLKEICLTKAATPLRLLVDLTIETSTGYNKTLTPEERADYEQMVKLKYSFSRSMNFTTQSFEPENIEYLADLVYLLLIFIIIAIFPFVFIVFYLVMRFLCKKCTGPAKTSQVTRVYRNLTWVLMIISSVVSFVLFTIILSYSVKSSSAIKDSMKVAQDIIQKAEKFSGSTEEIISKIRKEDATVVPDEEFTKNFKEKIESYVKDTKEITEAFVGDEKSRNTGTILLYVFYLLLMILGYVAFFMRFEKLECALSILTLFFIPGMIIFEGYTAKSYFFYSDLCGAVNGALYDNQFPVAGRGLGYLFNCFDKETKSMLYMLNYQLSKLPDDLSKTFEADIQKFKTDTLDPEFQCNIVYDVVPSIESNFCKNGLNWFYYMLMIMTWNLIFILVLAIGMRRLEVLIWKKRNEIESMIANQEALY